MDEITRLHNRAKNELGKEDYCKLVVWLDDNNKSTADVFKSDFSYDEDFISFKENYSLSELEIYMEDMARNIYDELSRDINKPIGEALEIGMSKEGKEDV